MIHKYTAYNGADPPPGVCETPHESDDGVRASIPLYAPRSSINTSLLIWQVRFSLNERVCSVSSVSSRGKMFAVMKEFV